MAKKHGTSKTPASKEGKPHPAHTIVIGRIRATIWANHHPETGTWYSTTVTRSFKQNQAWRNSNSFGRDDLLIVAEVSRLAFHWVVRQLQQTAKGGSGEPDDTVSQVPEADVPY